MISPSAIQNRAGQTSAVTTQFLPALTVGGVTPAALIIQSNALDALAQTRDNALADYDAARNAENQGFLLVRYLDLALPAAAEAELNDDVVAESALLDLLDPAYAITPRTTENALERGKKVIAAVTKMNAFLIAQLPPRPAITAAGKNVINLNTAVSAQPGLEQTVEDRAAAASTARSALRIAANTLDRLNKRFYSRLKAEARTNIPLADALDQIDTDYEPGPETLGIRALLQGGSDNLHILLAYENGTYDATLSPTVEWMVVGIDSTFTHSTPADPSGNALGPFAVGQTVKIRSRTRTAHATTLGSVRTLTLISI